MSESCLKNSCVLSVVLQLRGQGLGRGMDRLGRVSDLSDSGAEEAPGPAVQRHKRRLDAEPADPYATLKARLKEPCPCAAARKKNQASCFDKFLEAGQWQRVVSWREAFTKLHKLDQDQLAPTRLCRMFVGVNVTLCKSRQQNCVMLPKVC